MRACRKYWLLFGVGVLTLLLILMSQHTSPLPGDALAISFVGYTNSPDGRPFGLFLLSNQGPYSIRVHDDWPEIASSPERQPKTINPYLPCGLVPQLGAGESHLVAVGEPFYRSALPPERWRYATSISRYSVEERLLDSTFGYRLRVRKIRRLVEDERIRSATNNVTVRSPWIEPWSQK